MSTGRILILPPAGGSISLFSFGGYALGVSIRLARSADFQSAVSPISNRLKVRQGEAAGFGGARQNGILRYGRLEICATLGGARQIASVPTARLQTPATLRPAQNTYFGGEGWGEEVVPPGSRSAFVCHRVCGPFHESRFARVLPAILPLPFRRGEGRGEGSNLGSRGAKRVKWSGGSLPSPLPALRRRGEGEARRRARMP
jgi:hypothetical protein